MAVIDVRPAQSHATLTRNRQGDTWTAPYHVRTDNARDGADVIVDHLASINLHIGAPLRYGDTESDTEFCSQINPVRKQQAATEWTVTLQYTPPEEQDQQQPTPGGGLSPEPLDWRWDLEVTTQQVQVPVWQAWNVDPFPKEPGEGYQRPANTLGPVVNSAGVVLDPPLMRNDSESVIKVSGVREEYVQVWIDYINYINTYPCEWSPTMIEHYNCSPTLFDKWTLKVTHAGASFFMARGKPYWRYSYEIRFRDRKLSEDPFQNFDGWLVQVLDRGLTRWVGAGADDGMGGSYSTTDIKDGMAEAGMIRGPGGDAVGEMVLLDGKGSPIPTGSDKSKEGVYFRWRVNPNWDFDALPLDIFRS